MSRSAHLLRFAALSGVLFITACQDLAEPVGPDPFFSAAERGQQDLARWFAQASPDVMSLPMTVFADHDEVNGRLVFGIENAAAARGVQTVLERFGVPAAAYEIRVTAPIYMAATLRDRHRPTTGGLQIHWSNYVCTLGFNVAHAAGRSFITNSHCTAQQGTTGTTLYYQPLSSVDSSPIAQEAHDPAYTKLPGCGRGKVCRYSDAARALYSATTESAPGIIAKTDGLNTGSLTTVAGSFRITTQDNSNTSFSGTVHKVGRTTGWSSGNVTNTCATVNVSGSSIQLLCQTLVQNPGATIVGGGDSGSPVFTRGSNDDVKLVGILWGGNNAGDLFVFSPLKNIQDELGGMTATYDGTGGGTGGNDGGDPTPCVPRGNGNNCK